MDWQALAAQLVRARRGARTQKQLSAALGYQSNAVFAWENQRDSPSARVFFQLAEKTGSIGDLGRFIGAVIHPDLTTRAGVAMFLRDLAGSQKIGKIASRMRRDRHAVGRWLRGQTEINLPDLLHFVEVTSLCTCDFLAVFVDPASLKEIASEYSQLVASRTIARRNPWSHAIMRMADLPSYQKLERHAPGWFAARLGIELQDEQECLDFLVATGQLVLENQVYQSSQPSTDDARQDLETARVLASFWMKEGAERIMGEDAGHFAFNTFAVSVSDLRRLKQLQSDYSRKFMEIVAASEPAQAVAVATSQLFPLFEDSGSSEHEPSA